MLINDNATIELARAPVAKAENLITTSAFTAETAIRILGSLLAERQRADGTLPEDFMSLMSNATISPATIEPELEVLDEDAVASAQATPYSNMGDKSEELEAIVDKARAAYSMAKENASWAAAHTYMLWLKTNASTDAADWFEKQVKARNKEIDDLNKTLKEIKLPGDAHNGLAAGEKLVQIGARLGTSDFTRAVKYALDFIHPKQATNVSRYVLVIEWLHCKFGQIVVKDAAEFVKAITDAGGFETVVRMRRADKSLGVVKSPAKSKDAPSDKYGVLNQAKCLHEVSFDAKHSRKGLVVLIARFVEGKAQIIGELKLSEAELNKAVGNLDELDFQPPADGQAAA